MNIQALKKLFYIIYIEGKCLLKEVNIDTPHPLPQKGLEIPGRPSKAKIFKGKYEGKLEFSKGWGWGQGKDIFWNYSISHTFWVYGVKWQVFYIHTHKVLVECKDERNKCVHQLFTFIVICCAFNGFNEKIHK